MIRGKRFVRVYLTRDIDWCEWPDAYVWYARGHLACLSRRHNRVLAFERRGYMHAMLRYAVRLSKRKNKSVEKMVYRTRLRADVTPS